jgi:hypothetical protein
MPLHDKKLPAERTREVEVEEEEAALLLQLLLLMQLSSHSPNLVRKEQKEIHHIQIHHEILFSLSTLFPAGQ